MILEADKLDAPVIVHATDTGGCTWLKSEENEEARRLLFNPEEPRICIFVRARNPKKLFKPTRCEEKN